MENFRIETTNNNTILVKADSKRFGKDAILYEDRVFMRCFDYIRRITRENHFQIKGLTCEKLFTDTEGRTMPSHMWIVFDKKEGE